MNIKILQEVGLGGNESKVYLALLDLGSGLAGEITKKSGVNRTNVYDSLERLIEKGLATYVISANRKVFEPVNPIRLKQILKEKQDLLDSIMSELTNRYKSNIIKQQATVFRGKKGIKSIFELLLKSKKGIFVYGAESRFADIFPSYQKQWNLKRAELRIPMIMISTEKARSRKVNEKFKLLSLRFLPQQYKYPSTVIISGNKVATISWTEVPYAFMLESKEAAKSNMNFFNILWKIAKA